MYFESQLASMGKLKPCLHTPAKIQLCWNQLTSLQPLGWLLILILNPWEYFQSPSSTKHEYYQGSKLIFLLQENKLRSNILGTSNANLQPNVSTSKVKFQPKISTPKGKIEFFASKNHPSSYLFESIDYKKSFQIGFSLAGSDKA